MITPRRTAVVGVLQSLLFATLLCLAFYFYRLYDLRAIGLTYLPWNLFLAWLPLGIMAILIRLLRTRLWSDWLPIAVTIAWLLFLPNSFYLVSDYIHLQDVSDAAILYDVVMFTMFVFTGLLLGYASLPPADIEAAMKLFGQCLRELRESPSSRVSDAAGQAARKTG
jgi:uncharacterized membrane protein